MPARSKAALMSSGSCILVFDAGALPAPFQVQSRCRITVKPTRC
jgi:hypothetical protein